MLNSTPIPGLKDPLLSPSSLLDSGFSSSLVSRNSSDSLSSFVTARSHVSEEDSQGWGGWIGIQVNSFFDRWLVPFSQEEPPAITIKEDSPVIEEDLSYPLPLPEWVEPLFELLKKTVGERPSYVHDCQQKLYFNPQTGETAWQYNDDVTADLMDHKPLNHFYEILEQAVERGHDYSNQPVLNQAEKIMQSPISMEFFFKAFVISCDHPDYKNYVYLVDRDDVPKLTEHPDNPRVNIKGATWTNSKEDNEYIVTTLLDKPRDCLSAEWEELCFCFMYIAGMNLLVTPLIASLTLTQYSSMTPLLHAVRVSCMPLSFCNDACSFWISASVTIGLPIDCCLTGLYSLQLFDYCNWQDTPSFLVDETFNRFMGKIRSREAFALLFEDENSSNSLESSPALLFSQKPPSEIAKPSAMTMSR